MRTSVLGRARAACACALVAAGIAGCSAAGTATVTVSGKTLTIYLSAAPTDVPHVAADVLAAEELALQQNGSSVSGYTLRTVTLRGDEISDQARTAIQNKSAIAYLGEIVPGSSYASLGITNAVDLLQVSPTDTAVELTQATAAVPGAPDSYYEALSSYGRTFARVVPTSRVEAAAQVHEMQALGVSRLYVADDGGAYGSAIALAVKQDAQGKITLTGSESGADGVFYGSNSVAGAARFFDSVAASNPATKLFGPSALNDPSFVAALSPTTRNVYISAPGFLPRNLTAAGRTFVSSFTSAYGHAPGPEAIFGYEAMSAVLSVLKEAGSAANNRSTVVKDFFSLNNRQSVLGTYSIDANGDTSLTAFVFSRLSHGRLVPFAQVQG
jgi:branched-chain amino acid transport system substrate-binding protein